MIKQDLIPTKESVYNDFVINLYEVVTSNATDWKIPVAEITPSTPLLLEWKDCWAISSNRKASSPVDTENKNAAKKQLTAFTRPFIQKNIYLNGNMTDADRLTCGVTPHSKTKVKAGIPATLPAMQFQNADGNTILGRYQQSGGEPGSSSKAKPQGVGFLQAAYYVGAIPPIDPKDYPQSIIVTKSPFAIPFEPAQSGMKVWIASRWISATHIPGKWSPVMSMTIR